MSLQGLTTPDASEAQHIADRLSSRPEIRGDRQCCGRRVRQFAEGVFCAGVNTAAFQRVGNAENEAPFPAMISKEKLRAGFP
jgi:hypothetical protein